MSKADEIEEMIKSTENSINETCKLLQGIPFINKKSADEMFEKLGYKKYINEYDNIEFYKYGTKFCNSDILYTIRFYAEDKEVATNFVINMQELQAINQKCKELGWLDEC